MMNEQEMRKRFHENRREREQVLAKTAPLETELKELIAAYEPREKELRRQIKEIRETHKLAELDREAGMIARALNGKTGKPEDV